MPKRIIDSQQEADTIRSIIASYMVSDKRLDDFVAEHGEGHQSKFDWNDLSKLDQTTQPFLVFACATNRDAAQLLLRATDLNLYMVDASGVSPLEAAINFKQASLNCISRSLVTAILSRFGKDGKKVSARELSAIAVLLEVNPTLDHGKEVLHNMQVLNYSIDLKTMPITKDSLAPFRGDSRKRSASDPAPLRFMKPPTPMTLADIDAKITANVMEYSELKRSKCIASIEIVRTKAAKLQQTLVAHAENIKALQKLTASLDVSYRDIHSSFAELREYTGGQNIPDMQAKVADLDILPAFFSISCLDFESANIILKDSLRSITFLSTMTSKVIEPITSTPNPSPPATPASNNGEIQRLDKRLKRM